MNAQPATRPIRISINALGGQGGGVLADWIVSLAEQAGWIAQATSVPGVAQRTGATVYYLELCRPAADGREPVLALMPVSGDVDLVIASELMEAGRAIARGLVTSDRTVLVASSQRIMAISEKSEPGDGAMPAGKVVAAAQSASKRLVLADFNALAERHGSVISAALFGAVAGAEALPFAREDFEAAIRRGGVGVEASLRAFAAAFVLAHGGVISEPASAPARPPTARNAAELHRRIAQTLPEPAWVNAGLGVERCLDYQGRAHAGAYLDRLIAVAKADAEFGGARFDWRLTRETARYLALWMTYEDVIRVADLKTRAARLGRVRTEVRADEGQIVEIAEFMHPRFEEVCDTLPDRLGGWLKDSGAARRLLGGLFSQGRQVSTSRLGGFLLLFGLARLRRLRPASHRYKTEMARIEAWLASALNAARNDYDLGVEIIALQRLVKGYGETHERGLRRYGAILQTLQGLVEQSGGARIARGLAQAALKDDSGRLLAREIKAAGGAAMVEVGGVMTGQPARIFTTPMPVRFKHCDPAGIAFYPRLLEFANDTVEAWFAELGVGFPVMITQRGISTPTVALNAQFLKPCRHGEVLQSRLQPVRLGGSSLDVRIVLAGPDGDPRAEFDITLVCVAHGAIAAVPWPDDLRGLIGAWLPAASS